MKATMNMTVKIIKGETAIGCYSHQKNNVKYYVVVYKNEKHYGECMDSIFNSI